MIDFMVWLFGSYDPVYYYNDFNGTQLTRIPYGAAGVDWVWIFGFITFIFVLYFLFTVIRLLINR